MSDLGRKLFALVERDQGFAYVSDGMEGLNYPDERVLDVARGSLKHSRIVVKKLERFIATYEKKLRPPQ